jgi:hypothetical protein
MSAQERGISESEVGAASASPDITYTDRAGNSVLIGNPGGRRIKVVVRAGSYPPFVITAAD